MQKIPKQNRPKNHHKSLARPILARPKRRKRVLARPIRPACTTFYSTGVRIFHITQDQLTQILPMFQNFYSEI